MPGLLRTGSPSRRPRDMQWHLFTHVLVAAGRLRGVPMPRLWGAVSKAPGALPGSCLWMNIHGVSCCLHRGCHAMSRCTHPSPNSSFLLHFPLLPTAACPPQPFPYAALQVLNPNLLINWPVGASLCSPFMFSLRRCFMGC